MKYSITRKTIILSFISFAFLFILAPSVQAQTDNDPCAQIYLNAYGKCADKCESLGTDFSAAPNNPCSTGLTCCRKTANQSSADISQLTLQIPIFDQLTVDNLAQYIAIIYQYLLIILVPIAVLAIIIGGIMWILARGDQGKIKTAKGQIISALSGLVIALFSYVILSLVGLSTIKMPNVTYIQPIDNQDLITIENVPDEPLGTAGSGANPADCPSDSELQKIDTGKVAVTGAHADGRLRQNTLNKLYDAQDVAKKQGCSLRVSQAYRSFALQQYFYNCYITKSCNGGSKAARPNCATAPHMQGSAVDFGINCAGCVDSSCSSKLKSILNSVGWTHWSGEWWHYEYGTAQWSAHPGGEY